MAVLNRKFVNVVELFLQHVSCTLIVQQYSNCGVEQRILHVILIIKRILITRIDNALIAIFIKTRTFIRNYFLINDGMH